MNWLNISLGFVFLCNLIFLVGAAFLLYRIVDATEQGRDELLKAANQNMDGGKHLLMAARRSVIEMERLNDAHLSRETSGSRTIAELSSQIRLLGERLQKNAMPAAAAHDASAGARESDNADRITEDIRAKLQADLNAVLSKNHQLQDEIDQTSYRLKDATSSNRELREELNEVKGIKKEVVDNLIKRTEELEAQLKQARERAKAAEMHAENNAVQLDDIREQIHNHVFTGTGGGGIDQSGLIESQQDQIDALAAREKTLMERIDELEQAFQRNQTEKNFIEDRFLQFDSDQTDRPATPP
ncbi:MAG: hypothetical protein A3F78_05815 [Burkholderiales bacterium RIFCSPLOWO2_12_FULL_61_40]|nr:MAG: hypothetical protein A3F78_05815 [Burkholderiales bacterium RIFCSPLOWO2_12_FULL_61_40]